MKIIKFHAENFKRVKVVDITPAGNTVVISGKNGAGKSSVLDAIWAALGGGKAVEDIKRPIRDGAVGAIVKLELDGLTVTRKWTDNDKSYLTVENNGMVAKSPQAMLDKLVGGLSFDPLAFAQGNAKWQRETLISLTKLDIDLAGWEQNRANVYGARTNCNKLIERLTAVITSMPAIPQNVPDSEVSANEVIAEMQAARELTDQNVIKRQSLLALQQDMASRIRRTDEIKFKIDILRKELKNEEGLLCAENAELLVQSQRYKSMSEQINSLKDPEMSIYTQKLSDLQKSNVLVREKQKRIEKEKELQQLQIESRGYTAKLAKMEAEKSEAVKSAKYPVDGLGFNEFGVTYKGIPFTQCSSAERLQVSVSMAMAMNPELRVIRITDGSLLDSNNMQVLQDMVAERDYQLWIEVVDESGKMGVYIEDGEVANA